MSNILIANKPTILVSHLTEEDVVNMNLTELQKILEEVQGYKSTGSKSVLRPNPPPKDSMYKRSPSFLLCEGRAARQMP